MQESEVNQGDQGYDLPNPFFLYKSEKMTLRLISGLIAWVQCFGSLTSPLDWSCQGPI